MAETDWATARITVRDATPVMPCRSGRHGFHTGDCEDVDALNGQLSQLYATVGTARTRTIPETFTGPLAASRKG